ncbi:MAG: hypothetical protein Q4G34_03220 [Micrococcus sp.]|nr:hypothetical protein [Micrococcus sp.]
MHYRLAGTAGQRNETEAAAQWPHRKTWIHAAIIVQGVATILLALFIPPFGIVATIINATLALATRGATRRLFAGFSVSGALVMAGYLLILVAVT